MTQTTNATTNTVTNESIYQFGKALHSALFATPDTINVAYDQALQIANSSENPAAVMTAVQIVINAIAKELIVMGGCDD